MFKYGLQIIVKCYKVITLIVYAFFKSKSLFCLTRRYSLALILTVRTAVFVNLLKKMKSKIVPLVTRSPKHLK